MVSYHYLKGKWTLWVDNREVTEEDAESRAIYAAAVGIPELTKMELRQDLERQRYRRCHQCGLTKYACTCVAHEMSGESNFAY